MAAANTPPVRPERLPFAPILGYYFGVLLLIIGSFAPGWRAWGFDWWAYLPDGIRWALAGLALLIPVAAVFYLNRSALADKLTDKWPHAAFPLAVGSLSLLLVVAFFLFPARTHFLGDGYQLLARLVDGARAVKVWDFGASTLNRALYIAFNGSSEVDALTAFRTVAIAAGILAIIATIWVAVHLFSRTVQRLLFFLGIMTAGFCLQFFGYVEQYALMLSFLLIFTLVGVVNAKGLISRWWVIVPIVLAVALHGFALFALPALAYLLTRRSAVSRRLARLSKATIVTTVMLMVIGGVALYHYIRTTSFFFTFALLPIVPDRFTVDSDWLFSMKHFSDIANLLFLLVPGLPVILAAVACKRKEGSRNGSGAAYSFLWILAGSAFMAVFVFNPGIGMPRNWDLFAVLGVPLAVLSFLFTVDRLPGRYARLTAILAIGLGLLVLGPRLAVLNTPNLAVAHFKTYLKLDFIRNRTARQLLIDYYKSVGDIAGANFEAERWHTDFPSVSHNEQARIAIDQGRFDDAIVWSRRAIDSNPLQFDAYFHLGGALIRQGRFDSGLVYMRISDGINPYNAGTKGAIGYVHSLMGDTATAERYFLEALRIDSSEVNSSTGLVYLLLARNKMDRAFEQLGRLHDFTRSGFRPFADAAEIFHRAGHQRYAAQAIQWAQERGLPPGSLE